MKNVNVKRMLAVAGAVSCFAGTAAHADDQRELLERAAAVYEAAGMPDLARQTRESAASLGSDAPTVNGGNGQYVRSQTVRGGSDTPPSRARNYYPPGYRGISSGSSGGSGNTTSTSAK